MDPNSRIDGEMCTYADNSRIQIAPLDWSQNGNNTISSNVNGAHLVEQQQISSHFDVVESEKDGAPSLRMLIDEVEMLVQQVEENLGSEKTHHFVDGCGSGSREPQTMAVNKSSNREKTLNWTAAKKVKRCKKFEVDRDRWRRNSNKRKRMAGNAYESFKRTESNKFEYVMKEARKMGPPCNCPMSKKSKRMMCNEFTETERTSIFNNFWKNMNWGEKKVYVSTLVEMIPVKQHKSLSVSGTSRRDKSLIFHLMKDNSRTRVCKTMFLNTLDLGEWSVRHWVENATKMGVSFANSSSKKVSILSKNRQNIVNFLKMLPTATSPYCHSDKRKKCLEPNWLSINEVYREYVKHCTIHGYEHLSHTSFRHEFSRLNYSLYKPKKDQPDAHADTMPKQVEQEVFSNTQMMENEWQVAEEPPKPPEPQPVESPQSKSPQKRARKFEVDEMCWKRNSNKRKRMSGIAYESIKKTSGKYEYVKKEARKIRPPCNCSLSKRSSKMRCNDLSESDRQTIFDNFWKNLTWGLKKVYVSSLVEAVPVKQHRTASGAESSRRDKSLIFHLRKDNSRIRVCKTMFLNTLAIGEWSVRHWVLNFSESEPVTPPKRHSEPSANKQRIIQFLKHLPTYSNCSDSENLKWYLEPNWQSVNDVYRAYIKFCVDNGFEHLSHTSFRFEFAKLNYALYKSK